MMDLSEKFKAKTSKSLILNEKAKKYLVQGGSHTLRLWSPYNFIVKSAKGATVKDLDGNEYIDYWQGHYANILGHNPDILNKACYSKHEAGCLHSGFEDEWQIKLAELILKTLGHKGWKIRFTTSGTLANTYASMLALSYTGREMILKVGGGWHGASPYFLKGVKFYRRYGFEKVESSGIPEEFSNRILITRFNDPEDLESRIKKFGDKIACFIIEPYIGAGGFIPAEIEYLRIARKLTDERGIVLIFDEVISGFRFSANALHAYLNIEPDLAVFGKIIGGGHAVSAVAGKGEIMELCGDNAPSGKRVRFEGGTFSAHPEYMFAGYTLLDTLIKNEDKVYPSIGKLANKLRAGIEEVFKEEGIPFKFSGGTNKSIPLSPFFSPNFFKKDIREIKSPEDVMDEELVDLYLRESVLKLFLLNRGIHVIHGGGALSTAHTEEHVNQTIDAFKEFARALKKYNIY
ncbi:MAG: aspartate aminotransferase family protein [Candidatus Aminicenantia bacterium]